MMRHSPVELDAVAEIYLLIEFPVYDHYRTIHLLNPVDVRIYIQAGKQSVSFFFK